MLKRPKRVISKLQSPRASRETKTWKLLRRAPMLTSLSNKSKVEMFLKLPQRLLTRQVRWLEAKAVIS